jgi:hypothetical protein
MNEKYYTPTIEEFHVGFEYEYRKADEEWRNNEDDEVACDLLNDPINQIERDIKNKRIRVKYLDRADIESEGWGGHQKPMVSLIEGKTTVYNDTWILDKYKLFAWLNSPEAPQTTIRILAVRGDKSEVILFHGTIKNISELRRLQKQLGIK